jgi:hypothetical protein
VVRALATAPRVLAQRGLRGIGGGAAGDLDGARDGPPGLAAELEPGHPGDRGRRRRQVPQLRHHPEVVAYRDVLAVQAVPEADDVSVPDRELAAGRRERDRLVLRSSLDS